MRAPAPATWQPVRKSTLAVGLYIFIALIPMAACSSTDSAGSGGAGGPDAASPDGGSHDTSPDGSGPDAADGGGPSFYPQVIDRGGPRLTTPRFVAVTFANGDATRQQSVDAFVKKLAASTYWTAVSSEYGIGATTAVSVHATEAAPASATEVDIAKWLSGHVAAGDPGYADADGNAVYALYYPNTTKITDASGNVVCQDLAAYHTMTFVGNGRIPYAIIPQCGNVKADADTDSTAHELLEAVTDPFPQSGKAAYATPDDAHIAWQIALEGNGELADMCVGAMNIEDLGIRPPDLDGALVPRIWSNRSINAGHDPCVPAPQGEIYFNGWAVLPDDIMTDLYGPTTITKGAKIPQGGSRTIDVRLISDGATSGPWTVSAAESFGSNFGLQFSWDRTTGQNGDVLHLTITAPKAIPTGAGAIFTIKSTLGSSSRMSYGLVAN